MTKNLLKKHTSYKNALKSKKLIGKDKVNLT